MIACDDFSQYYAELLEDTYDCVDRVVLNAFYPLGQTGGGMRTWWRCLRGDDSSLDDAHLRDMAGSFSRRLHAFCVREAIPLIAAAPGERKHELAQPYLPNDPQFPGLFLVIKGNAPAPVWEVKHNAEGRITELRHRKTWPFVRHFYFHLIDPDWAMSRSECAAIRRVTTVKDGNCFIAGSDFSGISSLAAELDRVETIARLRQLCERWIYSTCLCFALSHEDRKRSGFAYQYSVFQLELSRNLLFLRGTTMDEVY